MPRTEGGSESAFDNAQATKMVGLLKYHAEGKAKRKDAERTKEAAKALEVWNSLGSDLDARKKFLADYEAHGGGKTADCLKFARTFKESLTFNKDTEVSQVENFLTRRVVYGHIRMPYMLHTNGRVTRARRAPSYLYTLHIFTCIYIYIYI